MTKLHQMAAKVHQTTATRKGATTIQGLLGKCGSKEVFVGFAPASLLHQLSFADILNEETGKGYQRRFSDKHSLDFRKYIQKHGSTTIPLTFNLRPPASNRWRIISEKHNTARLVMYTKGGRVLAQVDCQHRLSHLSDLDIPLAFMCFIGLNSKEEMRIFSTINGKAKGLSTSLLDFHETRLLKDVATERPELAVALRLTEDQDSPWFNQLDLGGNRTSGLKRKASLRTMQKAVKRFLRESNILKANDVGYAFEVLRSFWEAISLVMEDQWRNPRRHFLTKGIGVYSLSSLSAHLYKEAVEQKLTVDKKYFSAMLSDFINDLDWSNNGCFKGLGGEAGVDSAFNLIRQARLKKTRRVIHGQ